MEYLSEHDFETAKANGISKDNAYNRVYRLGWTVKDAITIPAQKRADCAWYQHREQCLKIGVNQNMFYQRLLRGWSLEKTISTPPSRNSGIRPDTKLTKRHLEIAAENGITANTAKARVHRYKWSVERAITEKTHAQFRRTT